MNYHTKQREILLNYFYNHQKQSFTANELLQNFHGAFSKATLYRNIDYLCEEKNINRFFNQNLMCYEYQFNNQLDDCQFHLHLKCIVCNKLIHLHCKESQQLFAHIQKEHGFLVNQEKSIIYGVCPDCHFLRR